MFFQPGSPGLDAVYAPFQLLHIAFGIERVGVGRYFKRDAQLLFYAKK